jgi:hypothetical protein
MRRAAGARTGPTIRPDTQLGREEACWSWGEQPTNQPGALAEAPLLGGTHFHVREFGFDCFQHLRQRDGELKEGSVQVALSQGVISAALPALGPQTTMPPISGDGSRVKLVAFFGARLNHGAVCRSALEKAVTYRPQIAAARQSGLSVRVLPQLSHTGRVHCVRPSSIRRLGRGGDFAPGAGQADLRKRAPAD